MGGRALKTVETRRCNRQEFDLLSNELINNLKLQFKLVDIPKFYRNKESFGDIDIIISTENFNRNLRTYIQETFQPQEIFHNGNCWSFDYKDVQIDFVTVSDEHFESLLNYMSWNDLGNFIGRIAHGFGTKFGQEGLWLEHYFKNQNIGEVFLSKDMTKILEFLDLSATRYQEGFDDLVDIFKFISDSRFFNWKMFQLDELNKINRDRNKKRASYMSFLKWVDENVANEEHEYISFNPALYFDHINTFFPEANLVREVRRMEYLECKKLYIKSKFNGGDVMKKYGLEGKELGDAMTGFKNRMSEYGDYEQYILNSDEGEIYQDFEIYLQIELENRKAG